MAIFSEIMDQIKFVSRGTTVIGSREIDLLQMRRVSRDGGRGWGRGKGCRKSEAVLVRVPTPREECKHYALQTWTARNE